MMLTYLLLFLTSVADTLSESYQEKWTAMQEIQETNAATQFLASNDLIFVVIGVVLLIWLALFYYLLRLDKKITTLENQTSHS